MNVYGSGLRGLGVWGLGKHEVDMSEFWRPGEVSCAFGTSYVLSLWVLYRYP